MKFDRLQAAGWLALISGAITALTGLALIGLPSWFYRNIGTFPPYNRHYEGDLGVFTLALGIGLTVAARDVTRYRLLIGVAAGGNLLHIGNHAFDALSANAPLSYWLRDSGPLVVLTLLLIVGWLWAAPPRDGPAD
jgi:hypothetical protein